MPRVQNPSLGPGQAPLLVSTVHLTAAQILALPVTPVVLIPAPGAGKMIVPLSFVFALTFGAHAYYGNETNGIGCVYNGQASNALGNPIVALITNGQSTIVFGQPFEVQPTPNAIMVNQALVLATDATTYGEGAIQTATLGAAGTGYAANDTGTVTTGGGDATYKVLTVGALGAVATFQITNPGSAYTPGNGQATATGGAQPGVGAGLTINVTAVTPGDGTLTVNTYYQIIAVP